MLDPWRLGNLTTDSFQQLEQKRAELAFIEASRIYPEQCRRCTWAPLCRGGCRRDRLVGENGRLEQNRYCAAFRGFFEYAYPKLAELVRMYSR